MGYIFRKQNRTQRKIFKLPFILFVARPFPASLNIEIKDVVDFPSATNGKNIGWVIG